MRCKNCTHTTYDYSEKHELCAIFGYGDKEVSENRRGEIGCKYNGKTLDKMYTRYSQCPAKYG